MDKPVRYDAAVFYRDQSEMVALVKQAARESNVKPSQFVRSAVAMALTMAGHDLSQLGGK